MAKLREFYSENFRNLKTSSFYLGPLHNIFVGANGSGKTNILELVYLLGTGKSFRTSALDYLIDFSQPRLLVRGQYLGSNTFVGIEKTRGERLKAKLSGQVCCSASELVDKLPLILVNADTFQLLEGGPANRRALLDWLLFHVKPSSRASLAKYKKVLAQRNEAIKRVRFESTAMNVWDELLVDMVVLVDALRKEALSEFIPLLKRNVQKLLPSFDVDLKYLTGWPEEKCYLGALKSNFKKDIKLGYTELGPHRADLLILIDGLPANQVLSRGQAKLLVIAIKLSQASSLWASKQTECVYLLDDLQSELDLEAQRRVFSILNEWRAQSLVTGTTIQESVLEILTDDDKVFHVKQGQIRNMPSMATADSVEY